MRLYTRSSSVLSLFLLIAHSALPVSSFGGLFGRPSLDRRSSSRISPLVEITKSKTILGVNNVLQEATVHIQLEYTQSTDLAVDKVGWVLPLPARPTRVNLGSALLFENLETSTAQEYHVGHRNATEATSLATIGTDGNLINANWTYCNAAMLQESCIRKPEVESMLLNGQYAPTTAQDASSDAVTDGVDVAGYFQYVILESGQDVLDWLNGWEYVLPYSNSSSDEEWLDLFADYSQQGGVFMALQLAHLPSSTYGTSQPIVIQYPVAPTRLANPQLEDDQAASFLPALHRLPLTISQKTAAPDATFEAHFLSDYDPTQDPLMDEEESDEEDFPTLRTKNPFERALPVNYLDVTLDDAFIDWMGCQAEDATTEDCFALDYHYRMSQAASQLNHPHCLVTEYAGFLDSVYTPMHYPAGLTVNLQMASSWLSFLTQLHHYHIPPIPLLLEILDQYLPKGSFKVPTNADNEDEKTVQVQLELAQACHELNHLYEAQPPPMLVNRDAAGSDLSSSTSSASSSASTTPTLQDCYDLYAAPVGWSFDAYSCAAELDNRVFQPARRAQTWMTSMTSLTRVMGRLDATHTTMTTSTDGSGNSDPYFVLAVDKPKADTRRHSATAVPVCKEGTPMALEFVPNGNPDDKFWQPAKYTCPDTWEPALVTPVFDSLDGDLTLPSTRSVATSVQAWGVQDSIQAIAVQRNDKTGGFDAEDVTRVVDFGHNLLQELLEERGKTFDALQASATQVDALGANPDMDGRLHASSSTSLSLLFASLATGLAVLLVQ